MKLMRKSLALLLCLSLLPAAALAMGTDTNLSCTASAGEVDVGDTFTVTLGTRAMTVTTFTGGLNFDRNVVEYVSYAGTNGSANVVLTDSDGFPTKLTAGPGEAGNAFGLLLTGTEDVAYAAQAELVTITFRAIASGDAGFSLYEDSDGADGFRADPISAGLTVTVKGGAPSEEGYLTYNGTLLPDAVIADCLDENGNALLTEVLEAAGIEATGDCYYKFTSDDGYSATLDADLLPYMVLFDNNSDPDVYSWRNSLTAEGVEAAGFVGGWYKVTGLAAIETGDHAYDAETHLCTNPISVGKNATEPCGAAEPVPADDAVVYVTISNEGVLALARAAVTVKDMDGDGVLTYDEALVAAHEAYCPGGYATGVGDYGLYVTKLWNVEYGGYMFYTNDVSIPAGVGTDTVSDGDELVAAILSDAELWSDVYTYFTEKTVEAKAGEPVELTLKASSWNLGTEPVAGAGLYVGIWSPVDGMFIAVSDAWTDADGKVTIARNEPGTYVISAGGTMKASVSDWNTGTTTEKDCPIIAPVCILTVQEQAQGQPAFKSQSLILSGQIGVNFYLDLSELTEDERSASCVEFTVGKSAPVEVPFDANKTNSKGYFGFTCYVKSIQMADTITAVYHYRDGETISKEYSVVQYIRKVEENAANYDAKTLALIRSIADYGHYAQIYLAEANGWTIGENYAEMSLHFTDSYDYADILSKVQANAFAKTIEGSNVTKATYKLHLDAETTVDVLLTTSDGKAPTNVKLTIHEVESGKDVTKTVAPVKQSDGRYLIRVSGISAHKLGDMMTITGTAGTAFEVSVCALSYVRSVLNSTSTSEAAKNGLSSLYAYYVATMAYRK